MKHPLFTLALASILLATAPARATGGISDGGANAVGNTLFDFYENEGTQQIKPEELPAYRQTLAPILDRIEAKVSGVKDYVNEGLKAKTWYFEPKEIGSAACLNASLVSVARKVVACQTDREVRISMEWFQKADAKNQAGLILHELFVHHTIDKIRYRNGSKPDLEASVHRLVRLFFATPEASDEAIQKELEMSGFDDIPDGAFMIGADRRILGAEVQSFVSEICPQGDRRTAERHVEFTYERPTREGSSRALEGAFRNWARDLSSHLEKEDSGEGIAKTCAWAAEYAKQLRL